MRSLFLFGRDLRLHDHAGLALAARNGEVIAACVQSPAFLAHIERSPRRAAFYRSAVASLAHDLEARGLGSSCVRARALPQPCAWCAKQKPMR